MEDFDFDKHFAEKMRRTTAPDLSDEDWEYLSPKLDAEYRRRWRVLPLWWLGILSGLLVCSNIGWWWMWQKSEQRSEALQTEWKQVRQQTTTQHDTVFEKVVIHHYDTVFQHTVYRNYTQQTPAAQGPGFVSEGENTRRYLNEKILDPEKTAPNTSNSAAILPAQPPFSTDTSLQKAPNTSHAGSFELLPTRLDLLPIPAFQLNLPEPILATSPVQHQHQAFPLIPKKFRIGAGGGMLMPSAKRLPVSIGFTTSLAAEIAFSEQFAITFEGAYSGLSFKGYEIDNGLGLPSFNPPDDDYELKHFGPEGVKPVFQLATGLRYWLNGSHRLSPYLGLSYAMQWHPEYELKVEYEKEDSDNEKEVSVIVPSPGQPLSFLDINAGVRYRFYRHWFWQTGLSYQFKIEADQQGIPRFLGLKSTVLYQF